MKPFAASFYKSQAWKKCRAEYAKHANHLCERCLERGIYKPGEIVHHITELTPDNITDPTVSLSFDNLQLLCRDCHAVVHNEKLKARRFEVGENGEIIATE